MRILIINNGTNVLHNFIRILSDHSIEIFRHTDLSAIAFSTYDALILTGSSEYSIEFNRKAYKRESEIISESSMPILGICLGFELICDIYGSTVRRHKKRTKGIKNILLQKQDNLFYTLHKPLVYENHVYRVETAPENFDILATSDTGIETIKHRSKCLYGVQFHPEVYPNRTDGPIIINNFLQIVSTFRKS